MRSGSPPVRSEQVVRDGAGETGRSPGSNPSHAQQLGARRDGCLGFGKAGEGRIRWGGTSWSSARGQPVDHLRVVAACLLTGQHRGKRPRCPRRHWHREDPLGVPTARRAGRRRRGCAHSHPLLETAAVPAAILVGGHATLQGCKRSEASGPEASSMPTHPYRQGTTDQFCSIATNSHPSQATACTRGELRRMLDGRPLAPAVQQHQTTGRRGPA